MNKTKYIVIHFVKISFLHFIQVFLNKKYINANYTFSLYTNV